MAIGVRMERSGLMRSIHPLEPLRSQDCVENITELKNGLRQGNLSCVIEYLEYLGASSLDHLSFHPLVSEIFESSNHYPNFLAKSFRCHRGVAEGGFSLVGAVFEPDISNLLFAKSSSDVVHHDQQLSKPCGAHSN